MEFQARSRCQCVPVVSNGFQESFRVFHGSSTEFQRVPKRIPWNFRDVTGCSRGFQDRFMGFKCVSGAFHKFSGCPMSALEVCQGFSVAFRGFMERSKFLSGFWRVSVSFMCVPGRFRGISNGLLGFQERSRAYISYFT